MVEDLCFHILDLVQNSVAAGAKNIDVGVVESTGRDSIILEVRDDGRGMDRQTLLQAQDPFFSSKGFKKVGLGIPLLKATTQMCHGSFRISSRAGRGTRIRARLQKSHLDCPPLGNLEETLLSMLVSLEAVNIRFVYRGAAGGFSMSSEEIRGQVGGLHFSHPEIYRFLRDYIHEELGRALAPRA